MTKQDLRYICREVGIKYNNDSKQKIISKLLEPLQKKKYKMSITEDAKPKIVKKENIRTECTNNNVDDDNGKKIDPNTYGELGENGEYVIKDEKTGYCFNYNSIKDEKTGDWKSWVDNRGRRHYLKKNPMTNGEWSDEFVNTLKKISSIKNWNRANIYYYGKWYDDDNKEKPCCSSCQTPNRSLIDFVRGRIPSKKCIPCGDYGSYDKKADKKECRETTWAERDEMNEKVKKKLIPSFTPFRWTDE